MKEQIADGHKEDFMGYMNDPKFPCIGGKVALASGRYHLIDYHTMDPENAGAICEDLRSFTREYFPEFETCRFNMQHVASFIPVFSDQTFDNEVHAATALHTLLHAIHTYDAERGTKWAEGYSTDPKDHTFEFSVGGNAYFVPFMHPDAPYAVRQSPFPLMVFNSSEMFARLKQQGIFDAVRKKIHSKEEKTYGAVPPLLGDFGSQLAYPQYLLPTPDKVDTLVWDLLKEIGGDEPFGKSPTNS